MELPLIGCFHLVVGCRDHCGSRRRPDSDSHGWVILTAEWWLPTWAWHSLKRPQIGRCREPLPVWAPRSVSLRGEFLPNGIPYARVFFRF
jgi:hypothetical protein